MVLPWLHFVLASLVLVVVCFVVLLLPVLPRLTRAAATEQRIPCVCKLALGMYCSLLTPLVNKALGSLSLTGRIEMVCPGSALWTCRSASEGVGADLLSQLGSDAASMLMGTLLPVDSREAGSIATKLAACVAARMPRSNQSNCMGGAGCPWDCFTWRCLGTFTWSSAVRESGFITCTPGLCAI